MKDVSHDLEAFAKDRGFTLDERAAVDYLGGEGEGTLLQVAPLRAGNRKRLYVYLSGVVVILVAGGIIGGRLRPMAPAEMGDPSPSAVEIQPPPAQMETGAVFVSSEPDGATIFVDGVAHHTRTPASISDLQPGEHELALALDGYEAKRRTVAIQPGDTARAEFSLRAVRGSGFVKISVVPWAVVYIDGDSVDTTPFNRLLSLSHGRHKLVLSNPDFPDYTTYIDVPGDETTKMLVDLKNEFGFVMLRVDPWADVYVDGEYKDTTPLAKPIPLIPGKHLVRLIGPSSATWEKRLTLEKGKTVVENVVLPPG